MFRLLESPTFVHSVEIFDMFQARCVAVNIPTFQNPTGRTYSWHSWEAGTTW